MKWYVVRRVGWTLVATWVILSITFVLLKATPDAGASELAFQTAQSGGNASAAIDAYRTRRGLTGSYWEQYVAYMWNMLTFQWGWSDQYSQPVTEVIAGAYPYSLMYGFPSVLISTVVGIGIGLYSATHQYTTSDYAATFVAFFGISIPNFWFGIMLLLVFAVQLGWVPVLFDASLAIERTFSVANLKQLILPIVVLTTGAIASEMRYARAEALEYVQAAFTKTARAKGAGEMRVLFRHILRPALVPLTTILVGDILGLILTSSYLLEVVFGIPGLGRISYEALINQDTNLVFATILIPTFIALIGNLLQDIGYTLLDPRVEFSDR